MRFRDNTARRSEADWVFCCGDRRDGEDGGVKYAGDVDASALRGSGAVGELKFKTFAVSS